MEQKQTKALSPMMELVLCMTAWAEEARRQVQSAHYPIDTVKRMAFLRKVGLTNTANATEISEYSQQAGLLQFMCKMWRDLGANTLLVKTSDFFRILCAHDLVCGDFSRYIGEIPEKNMLEIEGVIEVYEGGLMGGYANPVSYLKSLRFGIEGKNGVDAIRMPFVGMTGLIKSNRTRHELRCDVKESDEQFSETPFFIAAPRNQKKQLDLEYTEGVGMWTDTYKIDFDDEGRFVKHLIRTNMSLPFNGDPFVCSLCDYGVIIHSMWGAEAEDVTIKRYEQLRDAIIGKGGSR